MSRDAAFHSLVISSRMPASPEANQNENKECRPAEEERPHEPMAELKDVVDLIPVEGSVRRLAEKFINQCEAIHIRLALPPLSLDKARRACAHAAKDEN